MVLPTAQEFGFLEKVYLVSYAQTHCLVVISGEVYHSPVTSVSWADISSQNTPVKDEQREHHAISSSNPSYALFTLYLDKVLSML